MAVLTHGRGGYAGGCRCDACRSGQREYMREYLRQKRGFYDPKPTTTCERCGEPFPSATRYGNEQRFCSRRCQNGAGNRARIRASQRAKYDGKGWTQRRAEAIIAKAAEGTSSDWIWVQGSCVECGEMFTRHGDASPFCSKRCSRHEAARRRRARERGMKVSRVGRIEVHERDNWICHICGDPVNRDAKVPDLDAPVLDHVVALAAGGAHSMDNLKTAHFYCNSVKRDLPLDQVA